MQWDRTIRSKGRPARLGNNIADLQRSRRFAWGPIIRNAGLGALIGILALFAYVADCAFDIPVDGGVQNPETTTSAVLFKAADGSELATRGRMRGDQLAPEEISKNLKDAIVAIEDRRFYRHGAIDLHGMARALFRDTFTGRHKEGASTLTQQLARLLILSPERTLRRKVQEALIAAWLEHHLSKPEILARYLNAAYFGAGAYGADAAARRYFDKSARDLTLPEAAMIAGLVRAPSQLAPYHNLEGAQARAALVLAAMADTGAITKEAAKQAIAHPAVLKVAPDAPSGSGYVADVGADDVKTLVGAGALDLTATTTIDAALQAAAEQAVAAHLDREGVAKHATQAAIVAIGPDGAILAMVGGHDYEQSTFNRATQAKRQAGSIFKLFVYLTALQKGASADTMVVDRPVQLGNWEPHNFEDRYRGAMPLKAAFAQSVNTVAAQLGQTVGIPAVIKTARDLGVRSDLPDVPSLALGTAEVTLMEMTRAFATVASDQDTIDPFLIRRIASRDKALFNRPPQYASDADPNTAKLAMRDLLTAVVQEGTGKGARLSVPTFGKTGTTQDFRDAWFIGSGPDITVGVWVGNDDNSPMDGETGGDIPVKIWRDVVTAYEASADKRKPAPSASVSAPTTSVASHHALPSADELPPAQHDASDAVITGDAEVIDTSTLDIDGREIHLQGVAPLQGRPARALARHLRRRQVSCTPSQGVTFRCSIEGDDLATVILANGGSTATADAPPDLVAAQDAAQAGRRGIWRHRR